MGLVAEVGATALEMHGSGVLVRNTDTEVSSSRAVSMCQLSLLLAALCNPVVALRVCCSQLFATGRKGREEGSQVLHYLCITDAYGIFVLFAFVGVPLSSCFHSKPCCEGFKCSICLDLRGLTCVA